MKLVSGPKPMLFYPFRGKRASDVCEHSGMRAKDSVVLNLFRAWKWLHSLGTRLMTPCSENLNREIACAKFQ